MQSNLFEQWGNINWARVSLMIVAVTALWTGLSEILPPEWFKVVMTILVALQTAIAVIMRGSVYSTERREHTTLPPGEASKRGGQWTP